MAINRLAAATGGRRGWSELAYVVFEDLLTKDFITKPGDSSVKIHKTSCRFYVSRKAGATTVRWSEPFENLADAEGFAKSTRKTWMRAKCCLWS